MNYVSYLYKRTRGIPTVAWWQVSCNKRNSAAFRYPLLNLDNVVCFGKIQITTQLLHRLLEDGIDVSYFSYNGRYLGHTCSETSKNIFLRFSQYEYYQNLDKRLAFARVIVENKIYNQIAVIKKYRFDKDAYDPKSCLYIPYKRYVYVA